MLSHLLLTAALIGGTADEFACGPDWMPEALKQLIPQDFHGADFRPACRRHDAAYTSSGIPRRTADMRFRGDLLTACENSARPIRCQQRARTMYAAVRMFGSLSYVRRGSLLSKLAH